MSRSLLPLVSLLLLCVVSKTQAQVYLSESFDGTTFPPTGWTTNVISGSGSSASSFDWQQQPSGGGSAPAPSTHSGLGMANYNSYYIVSGSADLITPSMDFTIYSSGTNQVSFWMYRDGGSDELDVYANTSASSSSATLLGTLYNDISSSPSESSSGWYKYTFDIPASFSSSSTVYIVFEAVSSYGEDINIDDVSIDHIPPAPSLTSPSTTYCDGSSFTLTASDTDTSVIYYWSEPDGSTYLSTSHADSTLTITNATATNSGTYTVYAISGGDTSKGTTYDISDQTPTTSISSNSPICSGSDLTINTRVAGVSGVTLAWTGPNGYTSTNQSFTISAATFAASGTYYIYDTSAAGCTYKDSIFAEVDSTPVIASANGTDPTACNAADGSIQLTGLVPSSSYTVTYTRNDSIAPATVTIVADASGNVTIAGLTTGMYSNIFVTNAFGANCVSNTIAGPIVLKASSAPAPPTLSNSGPACDKVGVTLFSSSASTGYSIFWNGPNGFTSNLANPPIPNASFPNAGTYYAYIIDTNGCVSLPDSTVVVIKTVPDQPTASSNAPVCQGGTLNLYADCTTSGVAFLWSGPNSFTSTTQNPSINNVQLNAIGTYHVYSYLSGCISKPTFIDVYINWTPGTPTATNSSPICSGPGNALHLYGTDTSSSPLVYHWYGPNGYSSTSKNPTITSPPASDSGDFHLYVTRYGCLSDTTSTHVTIHPTPAPPTPTPTNNTIYCQYQSTVALSATGTNLLWYTVPTGGTGSTTAPLPSSATGGVYTWWVTQTSAEGCESQRAADNVTIYNKPFPPYLGPDSAYVYCQQDIATRLVATGQNLLWYTSSTGGVGSSVAPIPSTAAAGTTDYYVTQTVNGCESDRAHVQVIVKPKPLPPSVSIVTYCQDDPATPLSAGGANLLWYTTSSGGIGSPVSPTPLTTYADTTYYYVTQTVNGCESNRAQLMVVVNYKPNAIVVGSQPYVCQFDTMSFTYYGNATPDAAYNWTMPTGASIVGGIGQGPIVVRFDSFGRRTVLLLVDNHGCKSPLTSYTVDVREAPTVPIKMKSDICQDQVLDISLGYANEHIDSYVWDFDGGTEVYGANGGGPFGVKWDIAGPKYVKLVAYANLCPSSPIYDTVNVHPLADAHIQYTSDNSICAGDTVIFTAERYNSAYLYQWLPASYFGYKTNQQQVSGSIGQSGYIKLQVTTEYGCVSEDSTLIMAQACCQVYFPNAFTPNGDGKNDIFRPITRGNQQLKTFRVANRWGQVMFETTDQHAGWDGKFNGVPQDLGTYYYYIEYTCANGHTYKDKGEIILIR